MPFNIIRVTVKPFKSTPKPMIKIKDLPKNELYYTAPHAFRVDENDDLWVNGGFRCSITARTDRIIAIILREDGLIHVLGNLDPYNLKKYNGSKIYLKCTDPDRLLRKTREEIDKKTAKDPGFRWL